MAKRARKRDGVSAKAELPVPANAGHAPWPSWLPQAALIAAVTLWIYWPSLRGRFVWDDEVYIVNNSLLRDWGGLWKFWFQPGSWLEYYPVQETVLWLQWHLWGSDTLGYHLTNVLLHFGSSLLIWRLLAKFRLPLAWLGGLLFAVHPVQVESVAWICELKNTLSLSFFLLAMSSWIDYEEHKENRDYQWAVAWFLIAMLSKISMAPFPAVIFLYAWWKRGRIAWSDVKASLPFLVIALVLGFTTYLAGNEYAHSLHARPDVIPMGDPITRFLGMGLIAAYYFSRAILPVGVEITPPKWPVDSHDWMDYLPWAALVFLGLWCWKNRQRWGRHFLLGGGFFLLMLFPFSGILAISYMDFTWVMDHFLYIPIIGLIGLVVVAWGDLSSRFPTWGRLLSLAVGTVVIGLMAVESRALAGLFVNSETLWGTVLRHHPGAWIAHYNYGSELLPQGRFPEAISQFEEVLRLHPGYDDGYYNLGFALDKSGANSAAEEQYRKAIQVNPEHVKAYMSLGELKRREGALPEAEALFRRGLAVAPEDGATATDLGGVLLQSGHVDDAIALFEKAVAANPHLAQLHYNLGNALLQTGRLPEAIAQLTAAVSLDPQLIQGHENLGAALARSGQISPAIEQFEAALQLDPSYATARGNLALALAQSGRISEAIEQCEQILQAYPTNVQARQLLEKLRTMPASASPAPGFLK